MPKTIVSLPPEADLESQTGWRKLGKDVYCADRRIVLVVKTRLDEAVNGVSLFSDTYPAGSKFTFSIKNVVASKDTESVQRTAELTISNKLSAEFLSKQSFGIGASATGPSMSFGEEASQKISSELSTEAKDALSVTRSFELQNTKEIAKAVEVQDGAATAVGSPFDINLYLKLYEWHFDFYLVRLDQLTLEYKKRWLGLREPVRRRISSISDPKALPLFRLRLYEPIEGLSVAKGPYHPTVGMDDSVSVHVEPLTDPAPTYSLKGVLDLEKLASSAFPKTAEERRIAHRKAAPKKKAAAKKKAPAKAKRFAPARRAAKSTVRKSATAKKAARRVPARRAKR
ncbi:MAG TPA: hypothetical protein VFC29_06690 [Candidatus Limnocylindrales bacterium]|jgi:hypothetical protein|nr:hypothetical protein [Candidatus Limnocylindrales bacterium]